jgi:hypothetical protein
MVSLTTQDLIPRSHLHRRILLLNFLGEYKATCETALAHEKNEGEKSRDTVSDFAVFQILSMLYKRAEPKRKHQIAICIRFYQK